jgi:hypothetical protein
LVGRALSSADCDLALKWRTATVNLSLLEFYAELRKQRLDLPRPKLDADLVRVVDEILGDRSRHRAWILFLLAQLNVSSRVRTGILNRWETSESPSIETFSPYAYFCLRALLMVLILWVHKMTKSEANNLIDVQYLYYVPFCEVFASFDSLHRRVAPLLMREDQQFLWGTDFKKTLRDAAERRP